MAEASFDVAEANRWFAVETNNLAWDLLESGRWTDAEAERMIDAAHAACFHWAQVGTPLNYQRAQTLLVTAYARLGYVEAALRHAAKCLSASAALGDEQTPWDRASACASASEAYLLSGNLSLAAELKSEAVALIERFKDPGDSDQFRKLYLNESPDNGV